jgi:hypothetical protein
VPAFREDALHGRWVHSHEEDTDREMVFRPATRALPPSRGRTSFELHPDGTYVESSPGPVDVPEESAGTWSLDGDRLILGAEGDRPGHAWQITAADADRLAVRK